ncbi:MAG TPA: serine hydrolase [Verrucomicrobiae bacterium]|nr:serine hydrolase [Verrucomicrobiae bacterium]
MAHTNTLQQQPLLTRQRLATIRLWTLRALRTMALGVILATVSSVVLQLAYPRFMTLPQTRIGGEAVGFRNRQQLFITLAHKEQGNLKIQSGDLTLQQKPADVGLGFDINKDIQTATQYSWKQRLVPFSFFTQVRDIPHYSLRVDEAKARAYALSLAAHDRAPINAAVKLEGTKVTIEKGQAGYSFVEKDMMAAIHATKLDRVMTTTIIPRVVEPEIPESVAVEAAGILQQRLSKPLTVKAADKEAIFDVATIATWTKLTPDPANKKLVVSYDREKVKAALAPLAAKVYVASAPQTATLVDGAIASHSGGQDGRALSTDATADAMVKALSENKESIEGSVQPVVFVQRATRTYTRSSRGVQALLDYWSQSNGGQWGVVVRNFGGDISASHNGNKQFTSASVYKIYIAYVVYTKVNGGQMSMDSATGNGQSVASCMELMIVRSDNGCATALGDMIGWGASNGMLYAKGFNSTTIAYGGQVTTPNDVANYLFALESGGLLSGAHRSDMLSKMGRGIYRYAIPAGSPGMHVANKLGALGAYNHDVAIVYHPKGAYVLSVFTTGSSHAKIRELAAQINALLNQ